MSARRPAGELAPLPLDLGLLRALNLDVGLTLNEVAMLRGVGTGTGAVRGALLAHSIALRPSCQPSPWKQRRRQRA